MRVFAMVLCCVSVGCATSSTTIAPHAETVDVPRDAVEAALLIRQASARVDAGDRASALPMLRALLRSDLLTDHGRASLYWLMATAAKDIDNDARTDALGGFLVAQSVVDDDPELALRAHEARAALLALRIEQQALGSSPARAIVVSDHAEVPTVVRALSCGERGHYIDRRLPHLLTSGGDAIPRRLLCSENGDERTLWFRVDVD